LKTMIEADGMVLTWAVSSRSAAESPGALLPGRQRDRDEGAERRLRTGRAWRSCSKLRLLLGRRRPDGRDVGLKLVLLDLEQQIVLLDPRPALNRYVLKKSRLRRRPPRHRMQREGPAP
jgi:hypothetical protein